MLALFWNVPLVVFVFSLSLGMQLGCWASISICVLPQCIKGVFALCVAKMMEMEDLLLCPLEPSVTALSVVVCRW